MAQEPKFRVKRMIQNTEISDDVRAKMSFFPPVLEAMLFSLKVDRVQRLGGYEKITIYDLARETREGNGDFGICFELMIHEKIISQDEHLCERLQTAMRKFANVRGGPASILFGPEKDGRRPVWEAAKDALTDDSVLLVGKQGRPYKLRNWIYRIILAAKSQRFRQMLPVNISGVWRSDLFVGSTASDQWLGTTIKSREEHLQHFSGLRVGIFPAKDKRKDKPYFEGNLIKIPLPMDQDFMLSAYQAFFAVRLFLRNDARSLNSNEHPHLDDLVIMKELEARRNMPVLSVCEQLRNMSDNGLFEEEDVQEVTVEESVSLEPIDRKAATTTDIPSISFAPRPRFSK